MRRQKIYRVNVGSELLTLIVGVVRPGSDSAHSNLGEREAARLRK